MEKKLITVKAIYNNVVIDAKFKHIFEACKFYLLNFVSRRNQEQIFDSNVDYWLRNIFGVKTYWINCHNRHNIISHDYHKIVQLVAINNILDKLNNRKQSISIECAMFDRNSYEMREMLVFGCRKLHQIPIERRLK